MVYGLNMADDENKPTHAEAKEEMPEPTSADDSTEPDGNENTDDEKKEEETEMKSEDDESDEDADKGEELPPGLLEQPLEVQGKREKKKVERLSASMVPAQTEKKKVEIEQGSGIKLSEVPFIENMLNTTKAMDLKSLHRLLFLRVANHLETKKNIRQFCGFTHAKDSKEHERRVTMLNKMVLPELKSLCLVLGLDKKGTKSEVVERIMDFLMEPSDKGLTIPQKTKRKPKSPTNKKAVKRKRTSKKVTKKPKGKSKDDDGGDDEGSDEAGSLDQEEDEGDEDAEEEESEDEAPKKKKAKKEPKKKATQVSKQNGKKQKEKKDKKEPKKAPPKKTTVSDDSLSEDSDSDDKPLAFIEKNTPPSNDDIKEVVKKILDGADLETVTMKIVVKKVYGEYPSFDLTDRKDFIKETVREKTVEKYVLKNLCKDHFMKSDLITP